MNQRRHSWRLRIWIVLVLTASVTVQARELTIQRALELAVQHSHSLKKARAEWHASKSALKSARASYLPTLSVKAFTFYNDKAPSFDIELPLNYSLSREIGSKENYQVGIRLSAPLFTGGKISGNVNATMANFDLHRAYEDAKLNQLLYQTRVEYLSLFRAERQLDAARASLKRATIIKNDVYYLFSAGAADSIDLLEADLAYAKANLKVKEAVNLRRSAEIKLISLLNLPADESLVISRILPTPDTMEIIKVQPDTCFSRPQMRAAQAAVALSRAQVKIARSAYFPTISAYGGYSYGKPNLDFFNNTWNDYFTIGTQLNWSFNVGRKEYNEVQRAKHSSRAVRRERDEVAKRLKRETQLALENLRLAYQRYETAQQSHRISLDSYRLAIQKHRRGLLSSNRLLEIETDLREAEAALAVSLVDFYITESAYYYSIGSDKLKGGF